MQLLRLLTICLMLSESYPTDYGTARRTEVENFTEKDNRTKRFLDFLFGRRNEQKSNTIHTFGKEIREDKNVSTKGDTTEILEKKDEFSTSVLKAVTAPTSEITTVPFSEGSQATYNLEVPSLVNKTLPSPEETGNGTQYSSDLNANITRNSPRQVIDTSTTTKNTRMTTHFTEIIPKESYRNFSSPDPYLITTQHLSQVYKNLMNFEEEMGEGGVKSANREFLKFLYEFGKQVKMDVIVEEHYVKRVQEREDELRGEIAAVRRSMDKLANDLWTMNDETEVKKREFYEMSCRVNNIARVTEELSRQLEGLKTKRAEQENLLRLKQKRAGRINCLNHYVRLNIHKVIPSQVLTDVF